MCWEPREAEVLISDMELSYLTSRHDPIGATRRKVRLIVRPVAMKSLPSKRSLGGVPS